MCLPLTVWITSDADVEHACHVAHDLAGTQGLDFDETSSLVVAVAELATNLLRYAQEGQLTFALIAEEDRQGVSVASTDCGPGIPDLEMAKRDGFSTSGGLGSGLGVVSRQMDEVEMESSPRGTTIRARKWHRNL